MRKLIPISIVVWGLFVACSDDSPTDAKWKFSAEESFSYEVGRGTREYFRIEGVNGTITIAGTSNADHVSVTGSRRVLSDTQQDANDRLDSLLVVVDSTDSEVSVQTVQPDDTQGRPYIVDYTISVPMDFDINLVAANGDVAINTIAGDILVLLANGDVTFDATEGNVSVSLANGEVKASSTLPPGGSIVLSAANGEIDLGIPQTTSAELTASVANGDITVRNLDVTITKRTQKELEGTLGGGDGTISLNLGNGAIHIYGF